jgi:hypothetical protein
MAYLFLIESRKKLRSKLQRSKKSERRSKAPAALIQLESDLKDNDFN